MAAGKGTRFGDLTAEMPKGFIAFKGIPMIQRSIDNLLDAGIEKIVIGTGYHHQWYERLAERYPQIQTVFSHDFATTNSMETLFVCREAIGVEDFLLLESDIIYDARALTDLIANPNPDVMLVTPVTKFQDQYYIAASDKNYLLGCSTDKDYLRNRFAEEPYGELVGIHKISNEFYSCMVADYLSHKKEYCKRGYEFEIEDISHKKPLYVLRLNDIQWYEIDDVCDLEYAEKHVLLYDDNPLF